MILVTGATGTIGRPLVHSLHRRGAPFRALVRDPARAADLGAPLVRGDFDEPDRLAAALEGVRALLLNSAVSAGMVRQQSAVLEAARRAGVTRVVRVSAAGATPTSDRVIHRWHAELDDAVARAFPEWQLLRPTIFMQNLLASAEGVRAGRLVGGFGDGRLALIDAEDIAAAAEVLLCEPSRPNGAHELTGGEALSYADVAARLARALGRAVAYVDRPVDELVAAMNARGMDPQIAGSFGAMMRAFAAGGAARITSGVQDLVGRAPRAFDAFLADNLAAFR